MKLPHRVLIVLLVVLMLPVFVYAADSTLTVSFSPNGEPAADVTFDVFRLEGSYPDVRAAYFAVCQSGQAPVASAVTNELGCAAFHGMEDGNYLVVGRPYRIGDQICEPEMCMVTFPVKDKDGNVLANAEIMPKFVMRDDDAVEYNLVILWNDNAYSGRPEEVKVSLYRNEVLHTVLTVKREGNPARSAATDIGYNWRYSWTEDDPTAVWTVAEEVPAEYTATYERDGNTFIITNTRETSADSDGSKLPQTGQLWWPVPVLAILGMIFFLLGYIRRKESQNEA